MFSGTLVALVTPFSDGQIDYETLTELVEFHLESGTDGLVPVGTTGESPTLSHKENKEVVEHVVSVADGKIPVIAGTGSNSTAEAIEMTAFAKKVGADIVINSSTTDVGQEVRKHVDRGVDIAAEVVRITAAVGNAINALRKGGKLTLVGNISQEIEFPLQAAVTRELSINGTCSSSGEYPDCLDMIARKVVDVDVMISATAPLSEGASWFKRLYDREKGLMKVILIP